MRLGKKKLRRVAFILLTAAMTTTAVPGLVPVHAAMTQHPITVLLDGKPLSFDQQPILTKQGRVLVPFRAIFEALGAKVDWDPKQQLVTATRGKNTITMPVQWQGAESDLGSVEMYAAPTVLNGRTLVSGRFIAESLGATVTWDQATQTVAISSTPLQLVTEIEQGDLAGVKQYLGAGNSADVRVAGSTAVDYALSFHEVDIAKALVNAGGTYEYRRASEMDTDLHPAAKGRAEFLTSPAALKPLLPLLQSSEPSIFDQTYIEAAGDQNSQVVDLMTKAGASIPQIQSGLTTDDEKNKFDDYFYGWTEFSDPLFNDLLTAGLDPNQTFTLTSFHMASKGPLLQMAAILNRTNLITSALQHGAKVNATDANGWTALMHAAAHGNLDSVKALLQADADPNVTSTKGLTALDIATLQGNTETAQLLQAAGGKIGTDPSPAIDDTTVDTDPLENLSMDTDLEKASYLGHTDEVKRLLAGADPDTRADAIIEAGNGNNTETVQAILQSGPLTDAIFSGALLQAIDENDNQEMLDDVLSATDKLTLSDETKKLMQYYGASAEAEVNDVPMYQTFLKHGIAPILLTAGDPTGPLTLASDQGSLDTLSLMLQGGYSPKEEPNALITATVDGQNQAATMLLQAGADPNVTADSILPGDSMTALMYAVKASDADLVQALIQAGADVNAKTVDGTTALSLSQARENQAIIDALQAAGAKQ